MIIEFYGKTENSNGFVPIHRLSSGEHVFATYLLCTLIHQITKASYLVIDNMDKLDAKSFKLFVELLEDDTSYDNIILGAVNHDDTLEQLKGTGLKIVNL